MRKITILQGHPDNDPARLCRALAAAYAEGARASGHSVKEVDIARLDVPFLRTQNDFELGLMPEGLAEAGEALAWADHVVLVFPLWLGTLPALAKAFLEQVLRPGTAFRYNDGGVPEKLLTGRSVRIVVTMGMPAFIYRWWYGAHGLRGLERNIRRPGADPPQPFRRRRHGQRGEAPALARAHGEPRARGPLAADIR